MVSVRVDHHKHELDLSGTTKFLGALVLGLPVSVVLIYFLFGWAFAVLAMPLLLVALFRKANGDWKVEKAPENNRSRTRKFLSGLAGYGVLVIIPIVSVAYGNPEIMRLWAVGTAALVIGSMAFEPISHYLRPKVGKQRAVLAAKWLGNFLSAILFVLLSEGIWYWLGISVWIIYHAFGLQLLIVLLAIQWMLRDDLLNRAGWVIKIETQSRKARRRSPGDQSFGYDAHFNAPDNLRIEYQDIGLSQALHILDEILADPKVLKTLNPAGERPNFFVMFSLESRVWIEPASTSNANVSWVFPKKGQKKAWMINFRKFEARDVPHSILPSALKFAWSAKWAELEELLSEYITEKVGAR